MEASSPARAGSSSGRRRLDWLAGVAVAAVYFLLMVSFHPFPDVFEFDPDEGNRGLVARMVDRGYEPYSQVWNDQPPVFTYLPMWWCRLWGWELYNLRILVLLFASGIVFVAYDSLRLTWGHAAGLAAVALLPCTRFFVRLSVSAMVGLPSIAFALLCVWALLRWAASRRRGWVVLAGTAMGLSLMTKLFTAFLLPLFGVWVLLVSLGHHRGRPGRWKALFPPALWSACLLLACGIVLLLAVAPADWTQLYRSHLKARGTFEDTGWNSVLMLTTGIRHDWEIAVLAGIGVAQIALKRRWSLLIVPMWCIAAFAVLRSHSPVWYHHHLLLGIPGSLIAGVAVGEVFSAGWKPRQQLVYVPRVALRLAAVAMVVLLATALVRGEKHVSPAASDFVAHSDDHRFVVEVMRAYRDRTTTVVVDRASHAFCADYAVPPNLCVMSRKRLKTGQLSVEDVVQAIQDYDPEQLVFSRILHSVAPQIVAALDGRYRPAYLQPQFADLYVRSDIIGDPLPVLVAAAETFPGAARAHEFIGVQWLKREQTQKGVAAFRRSCEADPDYPVARVRLAEVYMVSGDFAGGFEILAAGLDTPDPEASLYTARVYAWKKATCPDPAHRDGAKAEALIDRVIALERTAAATDLATKAAALAAQGRFSEAVEVAVQVLELDHSAGSAPSTSGIQRQLDAYRQHKVWVESPRMPTW